jgi:outer membrane protein OmpA-like peptidoglycan-associated protein
LLTFNKPQGFMDSEIVDKSLLKTRKFAWVAILFGAVGIGTILVNAAFNYSLIGARSAMGTLSSSSAGKPAEGAKKGTSPGADSIVTGKVTAPRDSSDAKVPPDTLRPSVGTAPEAKGNGLQDVLSARALPIVPESPSSFEKMVNDMLLAKPAEFRPGSPILSWNGKTNLDQIIPILKAKPEWRFEIGAHISPSDTPDADRVVTERRAEAVAGYLGSEGISNIRMSVRGYGASKPIADNTTEIGRLKNQRIEIRILSTQ